MLSLRLGLVSIVLCTVLGTRRTLDGDGTRYVKLPAVAGVPELHVLYTSDFDRAAAFLERWSDDLHIGLMIARHRNRTSLLQLCVGHEVLIIDLLRLPAERLKLLPAGLAAFLEQEGRTYYGMALHRSVSRFAFECDCILRVVDFGVRTWPEMELGGGLRVVAQRHLGVGNSGHAARGLWERPLSLEQLTTSAENVHLRWALADHFRGCCGEVKESWPLTKVEMYRLCPEHIRRVMGKHDWSEAQQALREGSMRSRRRRAQSQHRRPPSWASVATAPAPCGDGAADFAFAVPGGLGGRL